MKTPEIIRFLILRSVGNFLILFSLFGVLMTFGPAVYSEIIFRYDQWQGIQYVVTDPTVTSITQKQSLLVDSKQRVLVPKDLEFSVLIPKIGANAEVIPNVDPTNEDEYRAALQKGIAHAKGTVFPGMQGTTYLFAHSTDNFWNVGRYNAIFYLLKDLVPDDQITVFFANKRYDYKVDYTQIIDPKDVDLLVNAQTTKEQLVLQTCWPPGTTFKRLIVVARPDGVQPL
jgi:sortase A